jgi:flagellar basal body rod protein FlgB
MPIPNPKDNEKQNDYMGRCMHFLNKKGETKRPQNQQVAICLNNFKGPKKKSKAEVEIDFSEQIKNMNKPEEIKVEEAPKIEAKVEEQTNTAVTAPAPEIKAQDNIVDIPDDQNTESLDGEKIQTAMLQMQHQYKILHWQTTSFSQHKSFDEIVSSLVENTDEFIETYMGKYGRVIAVNTFNITLANYKDTDFMALTDKYIEFLIGLSNILDASKDSDLLNIRDEILGSLNQLKYLLTLQ